MLTMTDTPQIARPAATGRKRVRAILLSDRIDTAQLEHDHVVSTVPLTYKFGKDGFVTLFRYGVAVMIGLTPEEEAEVLRGLKPRLIRPVQPAEEETVTIDLTPDKDDQILPGGPIVLKAITPDGLIVIADTLAKSVVLARDEREVAAVLELMEPFARQLAEKGRASAGAPHHSQTDRQCAACAAARIGPRRGHRQARRAVGPTGSGTALCATRG
jgi:uncharacterized Rmd1/YagE family protein